jgi:nucleoside-diphosphate-sugar epimerase/phosphoglycolate phosphatase-like HAD superfamily hydrolase
VPVILLTGATGFIGSHFLRLASRRYRVITLGRRPVEGFEHIAFDLGKTKRLPSAEIPPDAIVVHVGAKMRQSADDDREPAPFDRINFEGTERLLRALEPHSPSYILYVSTADVYAPADEPISELSPLGPTSPYGESKLAAENIARRYGAAIARLGNIYGPGEEAFEKFVPVSIRRAVARQTVRVSGNPLRDYLFVEDAARALLTMVSRRAPGVFNIVSGKPVNIVQVAHTINSLARNRGFSHHEPPHGVDRVFAPSALESLGWRPRVPLATGLWREIAEVRSHFRLIAIDLDGTLLDHWPRMYALYRDYLLARGLTPLSFDAYKAAKRNGKSESDIAGRSLRKQDIAAYLDWKRARIETWPMLETDVPSEHGGALFLQLAQRFHLALLTSRRRPRLARRQVAAYRFLNPLTRIVCVPGDTPAAKAAALRSLAPDWYIADTEIDIAAARLAGIPVAAVAWGLRSPAFLRRHRPDRLLTRPELLPSLGF